MRTTIFPVFVIMAALSARGEIISKTVEWTGTHGGTILGEVRLQMRQAEAMH
jgi:hypothetical protein